MNGTILPMNDPLAAYRQAALEIRELRRKGIRCHLEQHHSMAGPFLEIVEDRPSSSRALREKIRGEFRTPCAATPPPTP